MTDEIRKRIEQVKNGVVPEGYKRAKGNTIPIKWRIKKISDVLQKVGERVDVEKDASYKQIGIRSHGKGLFYKNPVSGAELGNKSVFWIEKNCFVVNIVFAWEQAIGKTTEKEVGMIGSHRFPMYRAIPNEASIDYLLWFFNTKRGIDILAAASPGGAGRNRTLGQKEFANSTVYLPPFSEQDKIDEILTHCNKVIELKKHLIAEERKQKKYLMQNLLNPDSGIRLGGFEGEWKKTTVSHISRYKSSSISIEDVKSMNSGIHPVYDASSIIAHVDVYSSDKKYISIIKDGAGIGRILRCVAKSSVIGTMAYIFPAQNVSYDFFYYLLSIQNFGHYATGSTIPHVYYSDYKNMVVYLPPIDEQTAIANILSTADRKSELLEQELEQWQQKKKSLMQLILTGIVRVNV